MDYSEYTFIFDVDGTICPIKEPHENYEDLVPYPDVLAKMKEYKAGGARILIHSSRTMRTYHGDISLINANTAPVMLEWLKKWDIPFDGIIFGKPWPGKKGFYVDDRAVRPREFASMDTARLEEICRQDRLN